jgi:hypothetical protein
MTYFGDLFEPEPSHWGLRGDPPLWRIMREDFRGVALPKSRLEVGSLIYEAFLVHTGAQLDAGSPENIRVQKFAVGSGMSDGIVQRDFWMLTVMPLIVDRWAAATESE